MEKKICGIYCIENVVNHKKYIGLSHDIYHRFNVHRMNLNNGTHINKHLQSAWDKYKQENFSFYIIEPCSEADLKSKEIYYISLFKSSDRRFGYNKTSGGDGVKNLNEECSNKISEAESLYPVVRLSTEAEFIAEYRNCRFAAESVGGKTENIRQCCERMRGRKIMYDSIWMYKTDYDKNGCDLDYYKHHANAKAVVQYDLDMNFIAEYYSAREAEKNTGIGYKMISRVCIGERPYTHGFIFKFKY